MISIEQASEKHVEGIMEVCTDGYWATYGESYPEEYLERIVNEFYNKKRILHEVTFLSKKWGGYFVALENGIVRGAGGGGMIREQTGEIFVLYINPERRNEGIGSMILEAITNQQIKFGAKEQWVSVKKGNGKGIPFYEAKGFTFKHEQKSFGNIDEENYLSLRYCRTID